MIRLRLHRWTCGKVADFIRGEEKPFALGWHEWNDWHENAKKNRPVRYWLAENGLNKLQNICYFPYDVYRTVWIYVRNRWIDQTHMIDTGLKPGGYYEFDTKLLHGLFNELCHYVEVELAHLHSYDNTKQYVFKRGHCPQAGLDYLDWAAALTMGESFQLDNDDPDYNKPTVQAESAKIIRTLYLWWKNIRPLRFDPHLLYDGVTDSEIFGSKILSASTQEIFDKVEEMEQQYEREDTDMLISLVKVRGNVWS